MADDETPTTEKDEDSFENVNELLDTSGPTIESLTALLLERDSEISRLKAANYDLITGGVAQPVTEDVEDDDTTDDTDGPSEVTEDDLF